MLVLVCLVSYNLMLSTIPIVFFVFYKSLTKCYDYTAVNHFDSATSSQQLFYLWSHQKYSKCWKSIRQIAFRQYDNTKCLMCSFTIHTFLHTLGVHVRECTDTQAHIGHIYTHLLCCVVVLLNVSGLCFILISTSCYACILLHVLDAFKWL